jgi:hypothetical protein
MAAPKAAKLRKLLAASKKTAEQSQKQLLKAEDSLSVLEDREQRRTDRGQVV